MKISVIIPVYNGEEHIGRCLNSLFNAVLPHKWNIEVIVVDDGSTDGSIDAAEKFEEIRIVALKTNSGRAAARKAGAEAASYDMLLLLDTRIEVSTDVFQRSADINYTPLMAGDLSIDKYSSDHDTLLYLIRRKFYNPYFPQVKYKEELFIERDNFLKAPKGTGWLLIEKELFLSSVPDDPEKDMSDDTLILRNIVFDHNKPILRHTGIKVKYHSRKDSRVVKWIEHRGRTFADHYLRFINIYSLAYFAFTFISLFLFILYPIRLILFLLLILFTATVFLIEEIKDIIPVIKQLPVMAISFYAGTIKKLFRMITGR